MKNINKISTILNNTVVWVVVLLLSITPAFAQDIAGLPDEPVDEPAAPIDGYVLVLAMIGLLYVFFKVRAFAQQEKTTQE